MELQTHPKGVELLDSPGADEQAVRQSLDNIARANRWFGGAWAVRWVMDRAFRELPHDALPLLLDVGAGAGDLAREAARAAGRHGITLRTLCLDRHATAARMARAGNMPALQGDAGNLPFRDDSVDFVLLSQIVHHFDADSAVHLLREASRVARRHVIIADLRRSGVAAFAFRIGALGLGFDSITAADGLTSIRRGFRPDELATLLARAGLTGRVYRRPGWRLVALATVAP